MFALLDEAIGNSLGMKSMAQQLFDKGHLVRKVSIGRLGYSELVVFVPKTKATACHTIDAHDINNFISVGFDSFCLEDTNPTIKGCSEEGSCEGMAGVWNDEILIITL